MCDDLDVPYEPQWGSGKLMLEIYEKTTEHAIVGPDVRLRLPARGLAARAASTATIPTLTERFEVDRRRPRARATRSAS